MLKFLDALIAIFSSPKVTTAPKSSIVSVTLKPAPKSPLQTLMESVNNQQRTYGTVQKVTPVRTSSAKPVTPAPSWGNTIDSFIDSIFGGGTVSTTTTKPPWLPLAQFPAYQKYSGLISQTERLSGIPSGLLASLLRHESGYNPSAVSPTGAQGIAQILPSTGRDPGYGVPPITQAGRYDPATAIPWAGKYLRAMYARTGSWRLALLAYNQGLGYALKNGRNPPTMWVTEGRNYVARITGDVPVA